MQVFEERVLGRRNSQCKIFELGMCLECLKKGKEVSVVEVQCVGYIVEDQVREELWLDRLVGLEWRFVLRMYSLQVDKGEKFSEVSQESIVKIQVREDEVWIELFMVNIVSSNWIFGIF